MASVAVMPTVTIVEDEKSILRSLELALSAEGFSVEAYDDPIVALPKVIFTPPDVLILNGTMPGMHGVVFYQKYREFSRRPVVFLSAWAEEIEEQLEEIGSPADAYVGKPFSMSTLIRLVRTLTARSAALRISTSC